MPTRLRLCSVAVVTASLATTAAFAQSTSAAPEHSPGPAMGPLETYRRHFGFYIRPDLGFGYMAANPGTATYSGLAGFAGVAIGAAFRENEILAVQVFDGLVRNPDASYGGSLQNTDMLLWGIGPQYTHYFAPSNAYFSATAALTVVSLERPFGPRGATNAGFGTRIAVGKEWWAGNHWGLGLGGQFSLSMNGDSGSSETMTTFGFGLAFSATYN